MRDSTGGQAYPVPVSITPSGDAVPGYEGMTLLDAAAMAALTGMLAHPKRYKPRVEDSELHWHRAIAIEAYEIAVAMVEQSLRQ